jgi:hypothetical protein
VVAGPFDVGERDAAERTAPDRLDDVRMTQRRDVAFALEARLELVDAARDVDREHQLEIDLQIGGAGGRARHPEHAGDHGNPGGQISEAHGGIRDGLELPVGRAPRAAAPPLTVARAPRPSSTQAHSVRGSANARASISRPEGRGWSRPPHAVAACADSD